MSSTPSTDTGVKVDTVSRDSSNLWSLRPAVLRTLGVFVVSWNRPRFLAQTLESLSAQTDGLDAAIYVVDNGSEAATRDVVVSNGAMTGYQLLPKNLGINAALESIFPANLERQFRYVLISDADMQYDEPLGLAVEFLESHTEFGAVSYQHSPEHEDRAEFEWSGRTWVTKSVERGCALVMRSQFLQAAHPLPVERMADFDWWLVRDAPQSLQNEDRPIAVLPGGARHLGWRKGDSTWQQIETPEFEEYKQ